MTIDLEELRARAEAGGIAGQDVPLTLQESLEVADLGLTGARLKISPNGGLEPACPIINIAPTEAPSPVESPTVTPTGNLLDRLEAVEYRPRPSLLVHVVPSEHRPGELSFRMRLSDRSWRAFFEALNAEGFKAGDVVRIEAIR